MKINRASSICLYNMSKQFRIWLQQFERRDVKEITFFHIRISACKMYIVNNSKKLQKISG